MVYIMVVKIHSLTENITLELVDFLFPKRQDIKSGRPPKCSNKLYLDAILYVLIR